MRRETAGHESSAPPWVGRVEETTALRAVVAALGEGRGGCVLVEGEPGIGKTALLGKALEDAARLECTVLMAHADELGQKLPLHVIGQALDSSMRTTGSVPADIRTPLWLLGSGNPAMAGVEKALQAIDRLCVVAPVLLVVHDLQWADEASLLVLGSLVRATRQTPLLIVGSVRSVPRREEVQQLKRAMTSRDATVLTLKPLSFAESQEMAGELLGAVVGPELGRQVGLAGGNPLYVREMVDALVRERRLRVTDGIVDLTEGPDGRLAPTTLGAAIADRLGFLTPATSEVLRSASLLGTEFTMADLCTVHEAQPHDLLRPIEEAILAGVLGDGGDRLRFRSALFRDALYEEMPAAIRAALHYQTARALAGSGALPERVAGQLNLVPDVTDGWTMDWLAETGPELLYRAPELAVDLMRRALPGLPGDDTRRGGMEADLVTAEFFCGRMADATRAARQVLVRTTDSEVAFSVTWLLAYALMRVRSFAEAIDVASGAARRWNLDARSATRLDALRALILFCDGQYDEGEELARHTLAEAEELSEWPAAAYALHTMALGATHRRAPETRLVLLDRALTLLGDEAPQWTGCRLLLMTNRAYALEDLNRLEEMWEELAAAQQLAEGVGTARIYELAAPVAESAYEAGRWDDAVAELESVEEFWEGMNNPELIHGIPALVAVRRGQLDVARAQLAAIDEKPWAATGYARANTACELLARALLAEREGRPGDARAALSQTLSDDWAKAMPDRFKCFPTLMRMALDAGDRAMAESVAAAVAGERAVDPRPALRVTDLWCRGMLEEDPEPLLEAAELSRAAPRPLALAATLEDAAVLMARADEVVRAKTVFEEAVTHYQHLGAEGDLAAAAARLREFGIRRGARGPRKRPTTGWDALTPTEHRVALLVAEGLSNPDIAARTFSSRRTVQTHVSHILSKLDLRSRGEIVREAQGRE
ncbi:AAA family ATPase [Streptomyces sp. NPDC000410]|uniref:helix-turn-helix transcriptional regulator n=1 Tax=Streptomyces sp. NPDC000410 TaxID=3154254 RepID=UPI00331CC029